MVAGPTAPFRISGSRHRRRQRVRRAHGGAARRRRRLRVRPRRRARLHRRDRARGLARVPLLHPRGTLAPGGGGIPPRRPRLLHGCAPLTTVIGYS